MQSVPKAKRNVSDLSDLLIDPDVNVMELQNISNEFIKDAIKATQFKRELAQASAALALPQLTQEADNGTN